MNVTQPTSNLGTRKCAAYRGGWETEMLGTSPNGELGSGTRTDVPSVSIAA
ncbi:MAG: hypothetical protein ABEI99_04545 [Halobaculum sp.]